MGSYFNPFRAFDLSRNFGKTEATFRSDLFFLPGLDLWIEQHQRPLLNPQLQTGPEKEIASEGCLSFPEISAEIERAEWIKVQAKTLTGETVEIEATGLLARALQHEIDHL